MTQHNYPIHCAKCGRRLGNTKYQHKAERKYYCAGHQPVKAADPAEDKMVRPGENKGAGATEAAVELAAEHGVDLAAVAGSGADGRILKGDVEAAVAAQRLLEESEGADEEE